MDINESCDQSLVDNLFIPIKDKFPDLKEEIEEIEFIFKNAHYNKNRLIDEIKRYRAGFSIPDAETSLKIADSIGLKGTNMKFEMHVPIILWADILIFEFHACLVNIIRSINFLLKFKLKNCDGIRDSKYPSIGQYYKSKREERKRDFLYAVFEREYNAWIDPINKTRNNVVHEHIIKKMQGRLIMTYTRKSENTVTPQGDVVISIPEYGIGDMRLFLEEQLKKLKILITSFFENFDEHRKKTV